MRDFHTGNIQAQYTDADSLRKAPQCAETLECKNNDRYKYFYSSIELIHILWINISRKQGLHFDEATWVISAQSSDHTLTHPQRGAITHALIARKLGSHNNSTFRTMTISVIYGMPNIYIDICLGLCVGLSIPWMKFQAFWTHVSLLILYINLVNYN